MARNNSNISIKRMNNGNWAIIRDGNKAPSFIRKNQKEAIEKGSEIAKRDNVQMNIYNINGDIRRTFKYQG